MTQYHAVLSEADFEAIEKTLLQSEKGRLFLRAYLARNRSMETARLLRSISRLHKATISEPDFIDALWRDIDTAIRSLTEIRAAEAQPVLDVKKDSQTAADKLVAIEASLLCLRETLEERQSGMNDDDEDVFVESPSTKTNRLVFELSTLFSSEGEMASPRFLSPMVLPHSQ